MSLEEIPSEEHSPLDTAIRRVADDLHRLNHSIAQAVDAGATVELLRASRYHCGTGKWGDQMIPVVKVPDTPQS